MGSGASTDSGRQRGVRPLSQTHCFPLRFRGKFGYNMGVAVLYVPADFCNFSQRLLTRGLCPQTRPYCKQIRRRASLQGLSPHLPHSDKMVRYLKAKPRCLHALQTFYLSGFTPCAEWSKGVDFHSLSDEDPVQSLGPTFTTCDLFALIAQLPKRCLPQGSVAYVIGDQEELQRRNSNRAAMAALKRRGRPESDLLLERPVLTPQRVFLVAFGGRRRLGDIVDHLEQHISNQN